MGSIRLFVLALLGLSLFSSNLKADAQSILTNTTISLGFEAPSHLHISHTYWSETDDFHIGTVNKRPVVIVTSSTMSIGGNLLVGDSSRRLDIGTLTVRGSSVVYAKNMAIGISAGHGDVVIESGTVKIDANIDIGISEHAPGGNGSLVIKGGSIVQAKNVVVGAGLGQGNILIHSGTMNIAENLNIGGKGSIPGGQGMVSVSNGKLNVAGTLSIGQGGTGALIINSESTVHAQNAVIGVDPKQGNLANGEGMLKIADSNLFIEETLFIGTGEKDNVTLERGLISAAAVKFGSAKANGAIMLNGGYLVTGSILTSFANQSVALDGGSIQAKGGYVTISGPGSISVRENGGIIDVNGGEVHITSPIEGKGQLEVRGPGIMRITGPNTYSGTTIVRAATLAQGSANAFSPNSAIFLDMASVLDVGGYDGTISGLSGTKDSIVKNDGAKSAVLSVGHNNALFDEYHGTIQDGHSVLGLHKSGPGVLRLTGSNSYTGNTTISNGTLIGNTKSLQGNIFNNAQLIFEQPEEGTFAGNISGKGSVIIASPQGKLNFNTDQIYTGSTIIKAGALSVNAKLESARVIIESGGILSGSGVLAGDVVNSGIIQRENNNLALTINGNYSQDSSGVLVIEVANKNYYDQITINGEAHLDGTLQVAALDESVADGQSEFIILTAKGGVKGEFSNLKFSHDQLEVSLTYNPEDVRLVFKLRPFVGFSPRQQEIAKALNANATQVKYQQANQEEIYEASRIIRRIPSKVAALLLEELAPLIVLNIKDILFNAANTQYGQLTTRLAAIRAGVTGVALQGLSSEPMTQQLHMHENKMAKDTLTAAYLREASRWDVFASASGLFSNINSPYDLPKINSMMGYFCAGADCRMNEHINTGAYVGYQGIKASYLNNDWLRSNGAKFGFYGTARWKGFYLNTISGGGANFLYLNRSITIGPKNWVAKSSPFAGELNSLLGGGYEFNIGHWRFGANNSIQYTYLGISSFKEVGAGTLNVKVGPHNPSSLVYTLGGSLAYLWKLSPSYQILPTLGLFWQHEFLNYQQRILGQFANGIGAPFYLYTPNAARNNAFGVAGVTAQLGPHTGTYAYYTPQFGGGQIVSHGILLGLIHQF